MRRYDAITRLVADHARHVRGQPDRSADIAAQFERSKAACERRGRATRRTAGSARDIVRIVGGAEDLVIALQVTRIDGKIGLAENDGARLAQARDRPCILGRNETGKLGRARGSAHSLRLERVLDGHRNAVERAADFTASEGCVRDIGFGAGARGVDSNDAIDGLIQRRDARQEIIQGFAAGDLTFANFSCDYDRAGPCELRHGDLSSADFFMLSLARIQKKSSAFERRKKCGRASYLLARPSRGELVYGVVVFLPIFLGSFLSTSPVAGSMKTVCLLTAPFFWVKSNMLVMGPAY